MVPETREYTAGTVGAWRNASDFVLRPGAYCARLANSPHWVVPLLTISATLMLLNYMLMPYMERATALWVMEARARSSATPVVMPHGGGRWSVLLSPFGLLGTCLAQTAILMSIANIWVGKGSFRAVYSLVVHTSVFSALATGTTGLAIVWRGLNSIQSLRDMNVPIGVNAIWKNTSPAFDTFLGLINPFQVACLLYLIIGIQCICLCTRRRAWLICGSYWCVGAGFQVCLAVVLGAMSAGPK